MKLTIKIKKNFFYTKKIVLYFEEAKVKDIVDFFNRVEEINFDLWEYIVEFVKNNTKSSYNWNDLANIYLNSFWIFQELKKTYFKWVFNDKKKSNSNDDAPISSLVAFVSKEWGINWYDLTNKMTFNELLFFVD